MEILMFFRKNLIFTALFSFSLVSSLSASSNNGNPPKDERIPIKLSAKSSKEKISSITIGKKIEVDGETEEEITEQTIWVDGYEIPSSGNSRGEHEFTAFLPDRSAEVRVTSLPVRLRNEWFNLELNYGPDHERTNSECMFSLHHHKWTE